MKIQKNRAIYIGLLIIVWACAYVYIFNEKIDINKIYSDDKFIDKEICQFMINKENKQ